MVVSSRLKIPALLVVAASTIWLLGLACSRRPADAKADQFRTLGRQAIQSGQFVDALHLFEQGYDYAVRTKDLDHQWRLLGNIGGVKAYLRFYQQALDAYLQASKVAEKVATTQERSQIDINIAFLYMRFGHIALARRFYSQAEALSPSNDLSLLMCRAQLSGMEGDTRFYGPAIEQAKKSGNFNLAAVLLDLFGEELIRKNDLDGADHAITAAFQLRKEHHDRDLRLSYIRLAWLRLEQKKPNEASTLMDRADAMRTPDAGIEPWLIHYIRGRIRQAQGDNAKALALFREAVNESREFQQELAPTGVIGTYTQERVRDLYLDTVNASLSVDRLGLDGFVMTEEDREWELTQTLRGSQEFLRRAPHEYWKTISDLRVAQAQSLVLQDKSTREKLVKLKNQLAELEIRSGLNYLGPISSKTTERNTAPATLRRIQGELTGDELLLSFHVGRGVSALWAVSKDRLSLYRLPAEQVLRKDLVLFRQAVQASGGERDRLGAVLYQHLFGGLDQDFRRKQVWVVTAEDVFFDIPMAALVAETKEGKPVYLVEQHAIIHTPSAFTRVSGPAPATRTPSPNSFLGVGDGVYNSADSRWKPSRVDGWNFLAPRRSKPILELARLAGSGRELSECARIWNQPDPKLLTGVSANRESLGAEMESRHPAVVHIAAHFMVAPDRPGEGLIDLGLTPKGQPELVTEQDVQAFEVPDATVVMSGCSSADAQSLPTSGVLGLTRSWLIARARAVIGSRWPTPDDTGELFLSFYRHLREQTPEPSRLRATGLALQEAQLDMLHSKSWRSNPRYWGAFYVLGKD